MQMDRIDSFNIAQSLLNSIKNFRFKFFMKYSIVIIIKYSIESPEIFIVINIFIIIFYDLFYIIYK